ncbi:YfiT family bacillithiol transferase [Marinicrinis lubricantis]|uniref:YfiT family bacillithiol transferase n=1 Tax=Marinicrinis lubricantis TaxID=2086470 RepID=A0ABW1IPB5_9BACL
MDRIRFPIGEFIEVKSPSFDEIQTWIHEIEQTPSLLKEVLSQLDDEQLDTPYRPGGWTVRQIVHHIADNNMNAYFRFKRTLTEEQPIIPSYRQDKWAEMADYGEPVEVSLSLIEAIYRRFVVLLGSLEADDYKRTMNSTALGMMSLETAVQRFLWHDRHHLAQIESITIRGTN